MAKERNDLASVYKTTIPELEEFQQLKPIHERLIKAENEISKIKRHDNKSKGCRNSATQRIIKEF